MTELKNKIVILGDSGVGKTSLITQWIKGQFNENQNPTIGAGYFEKRVEINDEEQKVQIWDTAGEERFQAMAPIYSQNSIGALIVFDLTRKDTMQHIPNWIKCLELNGNIPIVIAGNKSDLEETRQVSSDEALEYTNNLGHQFFETCANNGSGVDDAFTQIVNLAFEYKESIKNTQTEEQPGHIVDPDQNQNQESNRHYCC
ncbi:Ras- protein Rab-22A [Tritrichomonas musculus]|uniref:Ras- protein Rab-22A n=1 Tax=Tritrichomonas musculus TaxID=1915356 RepID=A0ABR2IKA5_9EUKA